MFLLLLLPLIPSWAFAPATTASQWSQMYICILSKFCQSPRHTEWLLRWFPGDNVANIQLLWPERRVPSSTRLLISLT
jgi:hypothetical protein